ncbi:MAG: hypothetical protein ABFD25_17475 [Clostridiaceae bacterium]
MKKYIVPKLVCVDLRVEERIADSSCNGSCTEEQIKNHPDIFRANIVS